MSKGESYSRLASAAGSKGFDVTQACAMPLLRAGPSASNGRSAEWRVLEAASHVATAARRVGGRVERAAYQAIDNCSDWAIGGLSKDGAAFARYGLQNESTRDVRRAKGQRGRLGGAQEQERGARLCLEEL